MSVLLVLAMIEEQKERLRRYLIPTAYRKSDEARQIAELLDSKDYSDFFIEEACKILEKECKTWELCHKEFALLFDPFQSTKIGSKVLEKHPRLMKALKSRIEKLGFPGEMNAFEYCLGIVGIELTGEKIEVTEEQVGLFFKRTVKKEHKVKAVKTKEEILKELSHH